MQLASLDHILVAARTIQYSPQTFPPYKTFSRNKTSHVNDWHGGSKIQISNGFTALVPVLLNYTNESSVITGVHGWLKRSDFFPVYRCSNPHKMAMLCWLMAIVHIPYTHMGMLIIITFSWRQLLRFKSLHAFFHANFSSSEQVRRAHTARACLHVQANQPSIHSSMPL